MDHAWYVRDVHEMRAWRRIGAVAWSFALAALFALAYITLTSTPTLRASAWATRLGVSLAFAATQLPPAALVAAMLRPSLAPLRVAGGAVGGGVDPWGVFAPPGSEARWAGARAPAHLFPAGFAASRWVSHRPPESPPDEMARDALGLAALTLAHVAAGAAACALLATAAHGGSCCDHDDPDGGHRGDHHHHHHHHEHHEHATLIVPLLGAVSSCALRAARYGAALGLVAAAHWVKTGASFASFAPVARPRLFRVKRSIGPACAKGGSLACVAVVVTAVLTLLFPMEDEMGFFGASRDLSAEGVDALSPEGTFGTRAYRIAVLVPLALALAAARLVLAACVAFTSALGHAPLGFAVAAAMASSRAAIEIVLTERYRFLPQTLDEGSAAACAPLLAALADDSVPWAQSLAFYDLCLLCEVKNGDGNDGRRDLLFDDEGRGATYAPAAAAALAPVLSVASATRAALDAAERAERDAAGGGVRIGRIPMSSRRVDPGGGGSNAETTRKDGVRLRSAALARASAPETERARGGVGGVGGALDARAPFASSSAFGETRSDSRGRLRDAMAPRRAGDAVASAAWAATADEWGMPSAVAPAAFEAFGAEDVGAPMTSRERERAAGIEPARETYEDDAVSGDVSARDAARELTRGFVEDELSRRAGESRRARDGSARARSLRSQMETPCAAAAREAKGVLAAHGQLALWGARAATALACAGATDVDADPADLARRVNPTAAATLRVLVAATRAAEACAAAGGGAPWSSNAGMSSHFKARCRVPELRDARAACAALADTFRACVYTFAEAFGAEETRRMLMAEDAFGEESVRGSAVSKTGAIRSDRPESPSGGDNAEGTGAAPRELVATLETILRAWE